MRYLVCLTAALTVSACTSMAVQPVDPGLQVNHVCIQENQNVTIDGFVEYLQDDFARHGITTEVVTPQYTRHCEYVLWYTARRSWDIATYMSTAELRLTRRDKLVAKADWHLKGKGGLSLAKFKGTESKLDDILDELLAGHGQVDVDAVAEAQDDSVFAIDVDAELQQLDALHARGIITDEEYAQEKEQLLAAK